MIICCRFVFVTLQSDFKWERVKVERVRVCFPKIHNDTLGYIRNVRAKCGGDKKKGSLIDRDITF